MGDVFEVEDPALDRTVAIKLIRPGLNDPAQARERFHREARAAAALHHDHVVPVFDFESDGLHPYLVMPLLAGETLKDRLEREPVLPPADVVRIGRQTAAALAAAHAAGLVHRDVKPSNLWLEALPEWRVLVLDFGLARAVDGRDRLTDPGPSPGTLSYMSPEQARGDPLDGRTDLYSLGVVLYEAAVGRRPAPGGGERSPPPQQARPEVPTALSDLIVRLLRWQPEDRPRTAADVVAALAAMEAGLPAAETDIDMDSTSNAQPPRPAPARGRPRGVGPAALFAVLVGALVAWAVWPRAAGGPVPPAGPGPGSPAAERLRLTALDVRHYAATGDGAVDRGVLGRDTFAATR